MVEAIRVHVRYDTKDEKGKTRRERNIEFDQEPSPDIDLSVENLEYWFWYWAISNRLRRVRDGVAEPIPPSEFEAWCRASGTIVHAVEYAILCSMDEAFCDELNIELNAQSERRTEAQKEAAKPAPRKRR